MTPLILASASAVRARLLQDAQVAFEIMPAWVDEDAQTILASRKRRTARYRRRLGGTEGAAHFCGSFTARGGVRRSGLGPGLGTGQQTRESEGGGNPSSEATPAQPAK